MKPTPLKRQLGSPALFGIVQGFIAASIYFSTGLVAERALGLTWAVFLAGGVLFAVIVPSYVEGASLHQERGGATVIARYAFNELVSFIAGWAICLDYLILVALCAFASTDYLAVFWSGFSDGLSEFLVASAVVLYVALMAIRGIPQSIGRAFAVRPGTPPERVAMLRDALAKTLKDPAFLEDAGKAKIHMEYISADVVTKSFAELLNQPPKVLEAMNQYLKVGE